MKLMYAENRVEDGGSEVRLGRRNSQGDDKVHLIASRYSGLEKGRFQRKRAMDRDLRPGELDLAVAQARNGDPSAIRYLYLRFSGNVYGYVRSMLGDDHDAEDVTQQVFARMIAALHTYEPRGAPFASWLLRIAANTSIDYMRRRIALLPEEEAYIEGLDSDHGHELAYALRDALAELPLTQRKVVMLRHVAGLAPGEIAKTLDCTESSVHALHHRGRRALCDALVSVGATPTTAAA